MHLLGVIKNNTCSWEVRPNCKKCLINSKCDIYNYYNLFIPHFSRDETKLYAISKYIELYGEESLFEHML